MVEKVVKNKLLNKENPRIMMINQTDKMKKEVGKNNLKDH
jgi:hypothetical protein